MTIKVVINASMKIAFTIILSFISLSVFAQDVPTDELKTLSDNGQYDKIIEQYAGRSKDLSAKSLFYIGLAYYMKENDTNCIKFMDLSIGKNSQDPGPYFIKASTFNYMQQFDKAIENFQKAIKLNPTDARFYVGLGDSYYGLKNYELALETYQKATEQQEVPDRPYSMIAQIYSELKNSPKALESFYIAKSKISKNSGSYLNALYNIGLLESLNGNYDKAEPAFIELIQLDSTDYHSYAKLIQIYYQRKDYQKAEPLKKTLYNAYDKELLKDNLKDMFCFDQFKVNDKLIQAFERYESGNKSDIYNKHLFYIVDKDGRVEYRIQTEFSPISLELGGPKYILCATKGTTHLNYGIGFNEGFKYDELKKAVIDIVDGKTKPSASTRPSGK